MKNKKKILWQIFVPTHFNDHSKIELDYHKEWDRFVEELTKGLTIENTAKGIWLDENGKKYEEKMIPVQISCTKKQIKKIVNFTAEHYKQKAVSIYKISNEFYIFKFDKNFKEKIFI